MARSDVGLATSNVGNEELMSLEIGSQLGHYEILGLLGAGGMGEVYRARDLSLEREVAVKVLPAEVVTDRHRLARFEREAKMLASLDHPHIVTIHAVESHDEIRFFVMELVEGRTLAELLGDTKLAVDTFFDHALPIVDAVAGAHQRGVTHRDLKPANVMVSDSGRVKVLDFGLAKDVSSGSPSASSETLSAGLTQAGAVLGTVPYMSPEQLQGRSAESTADVFALGVMLYEMATGERPFRGESQAALISSILRDAPRAASEIAAELPRELDAILGRCLEKEPRERYPSASELLEALARLREDLDSGISHAARIPTSVTAAKTFRTPMVGREAEAAQLGEALARAASGRGSLVTLAGEPGVGKTRLAYEVMRHARAQGFMARVGNCHEGGGSAPFAPWTEILDATARFADKETLRELLGDEAGEIAKLHPGLRRLYPDLPPPLVMPPEAERPYLFNCFRDFVERSSRVQPLLLVLEDLHWADEPTLLLLQHLAERLDEMAVLVLGTYRDVELDVARPLANALRELVRQRQVERIALGRLAESGVAAMLEALGDQPAPSSLVAAIYAETEGNPFFVEEVYEHLAEEGRLFDDDGQWRQDLTIEELDVPEGVRLVVGRRLERLDEEHQGLLTAAAVLGRRFSYSVLEAVTDAGPEGLLDGIEAAERLHLVEAVRSSSPRDARYQFAHELIRQTLLQGLSMPRRQRLHLQVAEAMERAYGAAVEEYASVMAHHLYQAGAAAGEEKTLRFLTLAADQALQAGGFEQALESLELALSLLPTDDSRARVDLLWKRGLTQRSLGSWEEAIADWQEALSSCERLEERSTFARISHELAYLFVWSLRPSDQVEVARRALDLTGAEESVEGVRVLTDWALGLGLLGQFEAAEEGLSEALASAERLGDLELQGNAQLASAYCSYASMRLPESVASVQAAVRCFESTGNLWYRVEAQCALRHFNVWMGRLDSELSAEEEAAAERLGNRGAQIWALGARTFRIWGQTADLDRFDECAAQYLEVNRRTKMQWQSGLLLPTAGGAFLRGDWQRARSLYLEAARHGVGGFYHGREISWLFLFNSYRGDREDALALLESPGLLPTGTGPNSLGRWVALVVAVEGLAVLEERERAAALYPLLVRAIETGAVLILEAYRLTQTAAGIGAAAARLWERAEEHFQTALRQADEIPFISEQADVRRWYAHMLLDRDARDDAARARQYLEEAIAIYRRIGMPKHVEMAETLLAKV